MAGAMQESFIKTVCANHDFIRLSWALPTFDFTQYTKHFLRRAILAHAVRHELRHRVNCSASRAILGLQNWDRFRAAQGAFYTP